MTINSCFIKRCFLQRGFKIKQYRQLPYIKIEFSRETETKRQPELARFSSQGKSYVNKS